MSETLNVRAARCLGFINNGDLWANLVTGEAYHVDHLKYDTDYNWAYLGVKVLEKKGYIVFITSGYIGIEHDWLKGADIDVDEFPSPAQITEAWVSLLEEQK